MRFWMILLIFCIFDLAQAMARQMKMLLNKKEYLAGFHKQNKQEIYSRFVTKV